MKFLPGKDSPIIRVSVRGVIAITSVRLILRIIQHRLLTGRARTHKHTPAGHSAIPSNNPVVKKPIHCGESRGRGDLIRARERARTARRAPYRIVAGRDGAAPSPGRGPLCEGRGSHYPPRPDNRLSAASIWGGGLAGGWAALPGGGGGPRREAAPAAPARHLLGHPFNFPYGRPIAISRRAILLCGAARGRDDGPRRARPPRDGLLRTDFQRSIGRPNRRFSRGLHTSRRGERPRGEGARPTDSSLVSIRRRRDRQAQRPRGR